KARYRARFVMACNSLPTFFDKSDGLFRRQRVIPFTVQIPELERDPDLAKRIIKSELSAIALWAINGLAEVIKLGRVPDSPAGLKIKTDHRANSDHEREFFTENGYEAGNDDDRMSGAELYQKYANWMNLNGYRPLGASRFHSRTQDIFPASFYGS